MFDEAKFKKEAVFTMSKIRGATMLLFHTHTVIFVKVKFFGAYFIIYIFFCFLFQASSSYIQQSPKKWHTHVYSGPPGKKRRCEFVQLPDQPKDDPHTHTAAYGPYFTFVFFLFFRSFVAPNWNIIFLFLGLLRNYYISCYISYIVFMNWGTCALYVISISNIRFWWCLSCGTADAKAKGVVQKAY